MATLSQLINTPRRSLYTPFFHHRRPLLHSHETRHPLSLHQLRGISNTTEPQTRSRARRIIGRIFVYTGVFAIGSLAVITGFFIYDATTYLRDEGVEDIRVSERALYPRRGGPKNLPIADVFIDDSDSNDKLRQKDKPKLVILGTGWGSVSLLKSLDPGEYHVTVVSPENYFLFTPMLPSATVGTLGLRSLVEPIRLIVQRVRGHFLRAEAVDVEFADRLVEICQVDHEGKKQHFYLPYDKLVIAVGMLISFLVTTCDASDKADEKLGSKTNTHGVKGLEHCNFLKSIEDARNIKHKVLENLEIACLPTTSDEERRRLLSFVICGGGPTGVEFAAELCDMLNEDLSRSFPKLLRNEVSVHLIQSRSHILNTYDETLSLYAEVKTTPFAFNQSTLMLIYYNSNVLRMTRLTFSRTQE